MYRVNKAFQKLVYIDRPHDPNTVDTMQRIINYFKSNAMFLLIMTALLGYLAYQRLPLYLNDRRLIDQPAIDFELGSNHSVERLSNLKGRKVLLVFWATWCAVCEREIPALKESYAELKDADFELLAITNEDPARVAPYIERHAMDYPIVYDADGRISYAYGVQALPTMVWIDAEGVVEDIGHGMEFALTRKLRYWVTGSIFSDS